MKIIILTTYYSKGMGYTENCLPRSLAKKGFDVHVVTSEHNVYGNSMDYVKNYQDFLGDAKQPCEVYSHDGYTVHRLPSRNLLGYIQIKGLAQKIKEINPDIMHSVAIASVQTYLISLISIYSSFIIFAENHHHISVVKPFLLDRKPHLLKRSIYWLTRTLPTKLASFAVKHCYAVAPDCLEVANRFYGVPLSKLSIQSLGTDTDLFHPAETLEELDARRALRSRLGFTDNDIVCVYTGRFTEDKNPGLLAQAVKAISAKDNRWKGVFVGEGGQREIIKKCSNCQILPFMQHSELADLYRAMDIGVWPRQESMSMLDAISSGLPLVVADSIGESKRVQNNGVLYPENDLEGLMEAIESLVSLEIRKKLGSNGRQKMVNEFSWDAVAERYVNDYSKALSS